MGLFNNKKEGGMMDVIRCDEESYLIWKWSPGGLPSRKENAIRYGSSLRVKDGEVAVFVYRQPGGQMQDYIVGPYDQTIKTANFPVLTSIVGSAFGGNSPFQAEVYFINLAGNISMPFFVDTFNLFDPHYRNYPVPAQVKGSMIFNITDYENFIKRRRLVSFELDDFKREIKDALTAKIKSTILTIARQADVPVIGIETYLDVINEIVGTAVKGQIAEDFAVNVRRFDISGIMLDEESQGYKDLRRVTKDIDTSNIEFMQRDLHQKQMLDTQKANAENYAESMRVMREETQRAQRLQTESANLAAHQVNIQGAVGVTAAESMGKLGGSAGAGMGGDGGMNPAAMMTGMMMGGAVGGQMSNMMGNMMNNVSTPQPPAPPAGAIAQYHISENGQQSGPFTQEQLRQMIAGGQFRISAYVWKQGMGQWAPASEVPEVARLFSAAPPPPPMPATPPPAPSAGSLAGQDDENQG